jgi:hypothetical protein
VVINREEGQCSSFARASQNVAASATLLDTLPAPSTDKVDKVYQKMKDILSTATAQQVESSLQCQVEVSVSTLGYSRARGQRATQEIPKEGTASLPVRILTHDCLSQPGARSEPRALRGRRHTAPTPRVEPALWGE